MTHLRTDDTPGAYYTPAGIINPATVTGDAMTPAAQLVNPPYHIETITQRLARLGVELAQLVQRMNDDMPYPRAAILAADIERVTGEIMAISESWDKSNE